MIDGEDNLAVEYDDRDVQRAVAQAAQLYRLPDRRDHDAWVEQGRRQLDYVTERFPKIGFGQLRRCMEILDAEPIGNA
jgi:hypothetical protein